MQKKTIFTGPISFLIVAIIAITSFTEGTLRDRLTICAFAVTALWLIVPTIWRKVKSRDKKTKKTRTKKRRHIFTLKTKKKKASAKASSLTAVLLRHVNHRVSDYLKTVFPNVSWEWVSKHPEKLAAEGGTGRIRLFNVPDFNYADVLFNQMAQFDCDLMRIVPFVELKNASEDSEAEIKSAK